MAQEQRHNKRDSQPVSSDSNPLVDITNLVTSGRALAAAGHTGAAIRQIAKAIRVADLTDFQGEDPTELRLSLRRSAAEISEEGGDFAEAIGYIDEIVAIQRAAFGRADKRAYESLGWKGEALLSLQRFEEALQTYNEILEYGKSSSGTPLARLAACVGASVACRHLGRNEESERLAAEGFSELEAIPESKRLPLALCLRNGAVNFKGAGAFKLASEMILMARECVRLSGLEREQRFKLMNSFEQIRAELAQCRGDHELAHHIRQELLEPLAPSSREAISLRAKMAEAAFQSGRLEEAESLLHENIIAASQTDGQKAGVEVCKKALHDFYLRIGKEKAAGSVRAEILELTREPAERSQAEVGQDSEAAWADGRAASRVPHARLEYEDLLTALQSAMNESGSRAQLFSTLDLIEERAMKLPASFANQVLDLSQDIRIQHSSEGELVPIIEAREDRLRALEKRAGRGADITLMSKHSDLAALYHRIGDDASARGHVKEGLKLLKELGMKGSFMYGCLLVRGADYYPAGSDLAARMRAAGAKIVRRFREE